MPKTKTRSDPCSQQPPPQRSSTPGNFKSMFLSTVDDRQVLKSEHCGFWINPCLWVMHPFGAYFIHRYSFNFIFDVIPEGLLNMIFCLLTTWASMWPRLHSYHTPPYQLVGLWSSLTNQRSSLGFFCMDTAEKINIFPLGSKWKYSRPWLF